jgi:hypothetical protein
VYSPSPGFTSLQGNFERIFPNQDVTAEEVITSIDRVMAEDAVLARYLDA